MESPATRKKTVFSAKRRAIGITGLEWFSLGLILATSGIIMAFLTISLIDHFL